jgi:hypothetical protein
MPYIERHRWSLIRILAKPSSNRQRQSKFESTKITESANQADGCPATSQVVNSNLGEAKFESTETRSRPTRPTGVQEHSWSLIRILAKPSSNRRRQSKFKSTETKQVRIDGNTESANQAGGCPATSLTVNSNLGEARFESTETRSRPTRPAGVQEHSWSLIRILAKPGSNRQKHGVGQPGRRVSSDIAGR